MPAVVFELYYYVSRAGSSRQQNVEQVHKLHLFGLKNELWKYGKIASNLNGKLLHIEQVYWCSNWIREWKMCVENSPTSDLCDNNAICERVEKSATTFLMKRFIECISFTYMQNQKITFTIASTRSALHTETNNNTIGLLILKSEI